MSVNKVILLGHVGQEPEIKSLEGGKMVANVSLATTERGYTLSNGTQVPEKTEWHSIVFWGGIAEVVEKYVSKGSQIYVEGKLRTRSWDKDGIKHYKTEILAETMQLLGTKKNEAPQPQEQATAPSTMQTPIRVEIPPANQEEDGGLPF